MILTKTRIISAVVATLLGAFSFAQESQFKQNYLGFTFFEMEANAETLHDNLEPKFVTSLTYERLFSSKWSFVNRVDYSENILDDNCRTCNDAVYGIGQMKEFDFSAGIKRTFKSEKIEKWSCSSELLSYYSWLSYTGDFQGGWSGGFYNYYAYRHAWGAGLRIGINFHPIPAMICSVSANYRLAYGWYYHPYAGSLDQDVTGSYTFPELRVGFLF
jgi:hypothetical protein